MRCGNSALFDPILDLGERQAGAFLVVLAAGGAAHSDGADRGTASHNGHPADRIGDIGQRRRRHSRRRILGDPVADGFGAIGVALEDDRK